MRTAKLRLALTCAIGATLFGTGCSATFGQVRMPGEAARHVEPSHAAKSSKKDQVPSTPLPGFSEDEQLRIALVQPIVEREAAAHGIDPTLVNAVIWVESRFRPEAKSSAGARGLMQLMPATAAHLAKELDERRPKAHDPEFNIRAGTYYLSRLLDRFEGDETLAIAAYNAGPGNVAKWQREGSELPEYSRDYVAKVSEARARFGQHASESATVAPVMKAPVEVPAARESVLTRAEPEAPVVPAMPEEEVFEAPVFEPAPELDRATESEAGRPAVAVTAAGGRWPGKVVEAPKVPAPPKVAPAPEREPEQDEILANGGADLPAPPVAPEVGPGILPDLDGATMTP